MNNSGGKKGSEQEGFVLHGQTLGTPDKCCGYFDTFYRMHLTLQTRPGIKPGLAEGYHKSLGMTWHGLAKYLDTLRTMQLPLDYLVNPQLINSTT